jgi:hypothetical protein
VSAGNQAACRAFGHGGPGPAMGLAGVAGNMAVQRLVGAQHEEQPAVASTGSTVTNVQREPAAGAAASAPPVPRNDVELLGMRLKTRQVDLQSFLQHVTDDVNNIRNYFRWVNGVYVRCYDHHTLVTAQASAAAESQQAWADVAFGVMTGVAVGALAEVAVAAAGIKLSYELVMEVAGELVEGGIAAAAKADGPLAKSADELAPALKQVQALDQLDKLNQSVLGVAVPGSFVYTDPIVQSERLTAELRVAEAGGARRMTDAEAHDKYLSLMRFEAKSLVLADNIATAEAKFAALRQNYSSRSAPSDQLCEQDIWIPWIAKQPSSFTSFFQISVLLNSPILTNHFVDIGLATRGNRGGRLHADVEGPGVEYDQVRTVSPAEQLVLGAQAAQHELPAYWNAVFLGG